MDAGGRYARRSLDDGIVAHAAEALLEFRDDRLRVVRLAADDEDGPVVVLDVGAEEVLRTVCSVQWVPRETTAPEWVGTEPDGDPESDVEQVVVFDVVMRDPNFDLGDGPKGWAPLRMFLPVDALADVQAIGVAVHACAARKRVAAPDPTVTVPRTPPPPHPDHPNTARADLAAAIDRMAHRDAASTAALAHLRHYPRPDEVVLEVMAAMHAEMPGVMAVTTTRVLFVHASAKKPVAHDYPVDGIHSVEVFANEGERPSSVKINQVKREGWFIGAGMAHWRDVERFVAALRFAIADRRTVGATLPSTPTSADAFRLWEELTLAGRAGTIDEDEYRTKMHGAYFAAGF
ncbi:hypothetical protein [uncultured Corynebacterium sp.]|uniref:hypothetical protein n=1 Tax=uncultured Corynebacterium sp. TaxID=159447 RepID=UPI0025F4975E|nr:hypothetical protein [uncultured Corynebacterium sp.]